MTKLQTDKGKREITATTVPRKPNPHNLIQLLQFSQHFLIPVMCQAPLQTWRSKDGWEMDQAQRCHNLGREAVGIAK